MQLARSNSTKPLLSAVLSLAASLPLQAQQTPAAPDKPSAAAAQASDAQCILAGRFNAQGRWAPQARGLVWLDAAGQPIQPQGKPALANVKAIRLNEPALLAQCNGNQALPSGEASSGSKTPAPALSAGNAPIQVVSFAYAPLRAGGEWVELKLEVPAQRMVMLVR